MLSQLSELLLRSDPLYLNLRFEPKNQSFNKNDNFAVMPPASAVTVTTAYMVAMAMSLSDRLSLAGLGTTGSSISNLDILDMVPF